MRNNSRMMNVIHKGGVRAEQKAESLSRILEAGARHIRVNGIEGSGIANVMREAGLTHGAFYAHFENKSELIAASLHHALLENRRRWLGQLKPTESWGQRLHRLAKRYLTKAHRSNPSDSCALSILASETPRSDALIRDTYEKELLCSVRGICVGSDGSGEPSEHQRDEAIALMALCVGGMALSRAVLDPELSDHILDSCISAAKRLGSGLADG